MKGSSMNFLVGLVIALFMFLVVGSLIMGSIFDAQGAAEGCSPIASIISDTSGGAIQPC
ncbi:MAG: hypothetical protein ACI9LV_000060 [Candidatus Nanohaloarchaea archaeon]|jgi:hypothetical protein